MKIIPRSAKRSRLPFNPLLTLVPRSRSLDAVTCSVKSAHHKASEEDKDSEVAFHCAKFCKTRGIAKIKKNIYLFSVRGTISSDLASRILYPRTPLDGQQERKDGTTRDTWSSNGASELLPTAGYIPGDRLNIII